MVPYRHGLTVAPPAEPIRRSLFVSYAREDLGFVKKLSGALVERGFDVWVDVEGLYVGEEFWPQVCTEIDQATAVVWVVSKRSAQSMWCLREGERAVERGKRLLPIVIDDVRADELPTAIAGRHWLDFGGTQPFQQAMESLVTAIGRDAAWVRAHTRLFARAAEWDEGGRPEGAGLRGRELDDAVEWLEGSTGREPPVHPLHRAFIEASLRDDAESTERAELANRISISRALTTQVELLRSAPGTPSLLPALLAAHAFDAHRSPETHSVLRRALEPLPRCSPRLVHPFRVGVVCFSSDGGWLATAPGMSREEEQQREIVTSARGPSLEDVAPDTPGMTRLRDEANGRNVDAFDAYVWEEWSGRQVARLGHSGRVRAMQFLPNSAHLATACEDGNTTIWSLPDGRRGDSIHGPGPVEDLAVSPDGTRILTINHKDPHAIGDLDARVLAVDGLVQVVRLPLGGTAVYDGMLQRELTGYSIDRAFRLLAASFLDGRVQVWRLLDGAEVVRIALASKPHTLALSPDGRRLAVGSDAGAMILDSETGDKQLQLEPEWPVEKLLWCPDGDCIVAAGGQPAIGLPTELTVWDAEGNALATHALTHIRDVAIAPDASVLAVGGAEDAAAVWDLADRHVLRAELHLDGDVNAVAFSADGRRVAIGGDDRSARVWDASFGLHMARARLDGHVMDAALSAQGRFAFAFGAAGCRVLDIASGAWVARLEHEFERLTLATGDSVVALTGRSSVVVWHWHDESVLELEHENVYAVVFSADDSHVVTVGGDPSKAPGEYGGQARIWDASTGRLVRTVNHSDTATAAAAHPDGHRFATASGMYNGHGIIVSPTGPGRQIHMSIGEPAHALAFSPNGAVLAVGFREFGLVLFGARSGRSLMELSLGEVTDVTFSRNGRWIAATSLSYDDAGSAIATTHIYPVVKRNRISNQPDVELRGESVVRFVEGGTYLATDDGHSLRIRETETGQLICQYDHPVGRLPAVRGPLLAQLEPRDRPTHLSVKPWTPDELAAEARRRLPRELTPDEWRSVLGEEPFRALGG